MDKDLRDDMLKLVRYKVLFVKREYEHAFPEQEDLVSDNMDGAAFTAWKIAEFIQQLGRGETRLPHKWGEKGYPSATYRRDGALLGLDEEDKKYLRVYYEVLERYPREKFKYEEQQVRVLEQIRDTLRKRRGRNGNGTPQPGRPVPPQPPQPQQPQQPPPQAGAYVVNSIGMRLAHIPAGAFQMGSPDTDPDANADEKPQHTVRITKPFMMGAYAVTRGEWRRFAEATGYQTEYESNGIGSIGLNLATGKVEPGPQYTWLHPIEGWEPTDSHPVTCVSWNDAHAFCRWLSKKEGLQYRLPTEAEWEYACRAGTATRFHSGDGTDEATLKTVVNAADASLAKRWAWRTDDPPFTKGQHLPPFASAWDDGHPFTAPVGSMKANAFGLSEMHGNVGEWCSDWYNETYYQRSPRDDPHGPPRGQLIDISDRMPGAPPRTLRVVRGGVWLDPHTGCRSADRWTHRRHPIDSAADIGFRVVMRV